MKTPVSILIVLALLMLCSCNQSNVYQHATSINRNDFKTTQSLIGSVVQFDNEVLKPTHLQVFDSLLFTINTREERTIHIFDLKNSFPRSPKIQPRDYSSPQRREKTFPHQLRF